LVLVVPAHDLCEVAGRLEIAQDERFATNSVRVRNRVTIAPLLEAVFRTRPVADWSEALAKVGVPCGPIHAIDRVFEDPQVRARGMVIEVPYAPAGKLMMVRSPIRMSVTPLESAQPPPTLGEHNIDVLWPAPGSRAVR
jgi:crotonobetainyl-CoA:carnitine CoA-transferase CaiB-like acyl-CoA transferase